jgi:protein SCO1/2
MSRSAARRCWLALLLGSTTAAAGVPQPQIVAPAFDAGRALEASQAAIGAHLGAHVLTDARGRPLRLADLRGKPLVISPVYTSCFRVCPLTTTYLASVVDLANQVVGEGAFTVLTVGFDTTNDTPERMLAYARARGLERSPQWIFAAASQATAEALLREIGFTYAPSAAGFDHMMQATVVGADGVIYRQVYGQTFEAPLLVDPLKRLALGQRLAKTSLPSFLDSVRLICTVYDPRSGAYRFDYSLVLSILVGVMCFTAVGVFIWRSWRQLARRTRTA